MSIAIAALKELIRNNPFTEETLQEIRTNTTIIERQTEIKFGFAIYPLSPKATLSRILFSLNNEFRSASITVKTSILREEVVKVAEKVQELNGRKHPKKKILEALSSPVPGQWDVLDQALAFIYNVQLVFVNEVAKKISFAPSDLRSWTNEKQILLMESNGAEAWEWEEGTITPSKVLEFLEKMGDNDWKITWPEAEGTIKAMEEKLESFSLNAVDSNGKKLKKEIMAQRLGKAEAIKKMME